MPARHSGKVDKGWGYELIWATNDLYCGKIMVFEKAGSKMSMHFHKEKDESWFVNQGSFKLRYIDTQTATPMEVVIKAGDTFEMTGKYALHVEDMAMATPSMVGDRLIIRTAERLYSIREK